MTSADGPTWTTFDGDPVDGDPVGPDLIGLAERCVRADGGMPLATEPWFLRRRWSGPATTAFALYFAPQADSPQAAEPAPVGGDTIEPTVASPAGVASAAEGASAAGVASAAERASAAEGASAGVVSRASGRLVAAGAVCPVGDGVVVTGLVDPAFRGRGLGARVLDHALSPAGDRAVTVEAESLTAAAESLFASRGFERIFAEDVMRIGLSEAGLGVKWPAGVRLAEWSGETAGRFHAVYVASFRDRPGFPGGAAEEWIDDLAGDDEFRPGWSVLASDDGGDVGFVTAAVGWIVQVGVVPQVRGRGLGAALVRESLGRMAADGAGEAWLNVNVNNPGAAALYRQLGFVGRGRRGRFQPYPNKTTGLAS